MSEEKEKASDWTSSTFSSLQCMKSSSRTKSNGICRKEKLSTSKVTVRQETSISIA